ncbi:hypothetical protein BFR40_09115 [Brochothrix thermosphacta]|uniref:MFS transporter n=1 Tax=Brochothrix thermosphacta TaxID=2756 RepID=UPI00083F86AB|nr:MFS transporter [Brochothrix thermosphacta]ODJ50676.1 hypothetical protein BFR40_09115 [Brochothrix thermosphacta]
MDNFNKIIKNFTFGGIGQNLIYGLMTGAYLFFFTEAAGFSAATIGTVLLVVRIYGLIADPIAAVLIEKTDTKWGKYKPYITVMPVVISLLLVALFYHPPISQGAYLVYIYILTILFWTAYAFFDISYWSLVPSITKEEGKRMKLLTVAKMGILFAAFGLGIVQMPLVNLLGSGNYNTGFLYLSIILAVIFTIAGVTLAKSLSLITEDVDSKGKAAKEKVTVKQMISALSANKPLISMLYIINTDVSSYYIVIDGVSNALLGVYSLLITNMVASTVEYGEWKTGHRTESIIFSTNTISSKLATGLSGAFAGWILTGIGYTPTGTQTVETLVRLQYVLAIVPAVGLVISAFLLRSYILTSDRYKQICADLAEGKHEHD